MNASFAALAYLVSGVLFILSLRGLSSPETSRQGNTFGMIGMALAVGVTLVGGSTAQATMPLQKKAKELGFEVKDCTFCHGEKLPKKDAATFNARGKWLKAEKVKRGVNDVDPTWLKEYKEPTAK